MTTPYQHLAIDPFSVAHRLNMPAALFSAFKKTACAGLRGHKDTIKDLNEAVISLQRYQKDTIDNIIPIPSIENPACTNNFILEVAESYQNSLGIKQIYQKTDNSAFTTKELIAQTRYLAATNILKLHHPSTRLIEHQVIIKNTIELIQNTIDLAESKAALNIIQQEVNLNPDCIDLNLQDLLPAKDSLQLLAGAAILSIILILINLI